MRHIFVSCCGECPYIDDGEVSSRGERWTNDSCIKLHDIEPHYKAIIRDKTKMLIDCPLSWAYGEDNYDR